MSIVSQLEYEIINDHFEKDTHVDIQGLEIDQYRILAGETPNHDVLVVSYVGSPNMSFYDSNGMLIDIDHYLPDSYKKEDLRAARTIIANFKNYSNTFKNKKQYENLIDETFKAGNGSLVIGLLNKFNFNTTNGIFKTFITNISFSGPDENLQSYLLKRYKTFHDFAEEYVLCHLKNSNGYTHITPKGNIIITTLSKKSGIAVIIETKDHEGRLLSPNRWHISRTDNIIELEQNLVFRSEDIRSFFESEAYKVSIISERYQINLDLDEITIDSRLDNTDNVISLELINNCFQILSTDHNIIIVLSHDQEITILNTHRSVVPQKWPKKIVLPEPSIWVAIDENLSILFTQNINGEIKAVDITSDEKSIIANLGKFKPKFTINQNGDLICKNIKSDALVKIKTNTLFLESSQDQKTFTSLFNNLSHLFKGENLFTKIEYAKDSSKAPKVIENILPSATETSRFDFEANIEQMLVSAENDYLKLLQVKNKIAIARLNISEELITEAEKENIFLAGQRLRSTLNAIIKPSEDRLNKLLEKVRSRDILEETRIFMKDISKLSDPDMYREILNSVRSFDEELKLMSLHSTDPIIDEFREIQKTLNAAFSDQISNDGTVLQGFIHGEIEQIEDTISKTYDIRQLELILSTHPAAIELLNLLKQPFVLQSVAKEKKLSPAGIQKRLHESISKRKKDLMLEIEKKEKEKNAAKLQLVNMINESIDFFVLNHSQGFSDIELSSNANYRQIIADILKVERTFKDVRLSMELRRKLEKRILEKNRKDLEKIIAFEGKYAFIQNDLDLYIDWDSIIGKFPKWELKLTEKKGETDTYSINFIRDTDKEIYQPDSTENLKSGNAFEINKNENADFFKGYELYNNPEIDVKILEAVWEICNKKKSETDFPEFKKKKINDLLPKSETERKSLRCALENKKRDHFERNRTRQVPNIAPEFIDETPFFQRKLHEFIIKAKLQKLSGSGILLLSGPPSTGKSAFLKFISSLMNREYFEHASDKWQTKNSLITAIKFGEYGPYSIPAGFTKAITTPYSLINIEEIKEWPEALRKSLNPFFAGAKTFVGPDGTKYPIGENILLCAAANLGAMYRQDDEPFTADFWSRIEVIEYNYAPQHVERDYYEKLHQPTKTKLLSIQDLVRYYFNYSSSPISPEEKAIYFAEQFISFILLPKADENIKRENLGNFIQDYFINDANIKSDTFSPEEAVKVALRRLKELQGYNPSEFFDLYDHYVNEKHIRTYKISMLQSSDIDRYEHLKVIFLCLKHIEGCLRKLREVFYSSAGQTEIEGTNREFIKCVYLLGLIGKM